MATARTSIGRILVATDFSESAELAVSEAVALARRTGAELVVAHAMDPHDARAQSATRGTLEEIRSRLAREHANVSAHLLEGRAAEAIGDAAIRIDADLVVVGTHGRTGYRRVLLGSVAERVIRSCERAVLVARGGSIDQGYRSVLAATDFSADAEHAMQIATALAAPESTLRIVHYYLLPSITAGPDVADATRDIEHAFAERVATYHRELGRDGLAIQFHGELGHAARGLLETIDTGSYDLVALGRSQRVGVRGHTLGTVAESVARHARCSALVAPARP